MNHSNILWYFLGGVLLIFFLAYTGLLETNLLPSESTSTRTLGMGEKHGAVKTYDPSGNLHTLVTYDHGIKEGPSYIYYDNGQVLLEMPYKKGKREGESIKYYRDGSIYAVTPYVNDELTGMRKTYYQNGGVKGIIPYLKGHAGLGLTEYFTNGNPKDLAGINTRVSRQKGRKLLILEIPDCNKVQFYTGALFNNRYLIPDTEYVKPLPMQGDRSYIPLDNILPPINIICDCTTDSGHPYITRLVYNQ